MDHSTSGLPVPHHLPEFSQVHVHCISDAIQPSQTLMPSSSAPSLSQHHGLLQCIDCIRWPKCWRFSFSISPSNDYLELISFKIDWFDYLAVQETLKSRVQHHSSRHQFFDWLILYLRASKYATINVEFLFSSLTFCILYFETFSHVKSEGVSPVQLFASP